MFFTNYELIYKKSSENHNSEPDIPSCNNEEKIENTLKAESILTTKNTESQSLNFIKDAVDYIKSDETKEKITFLKKQIKSAASELGNNISEISERLSAVTKQKFDELKNNQNDIAVTENSQHNEEKTEDTFHTDESEEKVSFLKNNIKSAASESGNNISEISEKVSTFTEQKFDELKNNQNNITVTETSQHSEEKTENTFNTDETEEKVSSLKNNIKSVASELRNNISEISEKVSTFTEQKFDELKNNQNNITATENSQHNEEKTEDTFHTDESEEKITFLKKQIKSAVSESGNNISESNQEALTFNEKKYDFNNESVTENSQYISNVDNNTPSKTTPFLIGIMILLFIIMGLLIFIIFSQNKNNKEQNNNAIIKSDSSESSEEFTENTTESELIITEHKETSTNSVIKETATLTNQIEPITTQKTKEAVLSYKDSYKKIINDEIERFRKNVGSNFSIDYTLFDMDSDGIPELLTRSGTCEADSLISIYTYKNNKYSQIGNNIGGSHTHFAFDYIANQIVLCNSHMGNITLSWYDIDGNGNLRFLIDTSSSGNDYNTYAVFMKSYNVLNYPFVSYSNSSDITWVYYNVDNYECYADSEYSGINFSFIDNDDSLKATVDNIIAIAAATPASEAYTPPGETYAFSGVVNTESSDLNVRERPSTDSAILGTLPKGTSVSVYNIDGYSDWYKVYCSQYNLSGYVSAQYVKETKGMTYDTSAAGSDFSFFNEPYSRKVITESDPLNLRSAPSTSAEIIIKMPKGSLVKLYGSDGGGLFGGLDNSSEWSNISYTENGITYYGYASSEFIGLP